MIKKFILLSVLTLCLLGLMTVPLLNPDKLATNSLFTSSAYAQVSRITIEGADSTLSYGLQQSEQLEQQAASVSPRILVEYADSMLSFDLVPPVFISNEPPIANAGADQTMAVGATVTLDASASRDTDGSIVTYEWDFGDGAKSTGKIVTHTYSEVGTYAVTLTVTDNHGIKTSDTLTVQVNRENNPPVISGLSAEQAQVLPGATTTIIATVYDPDKDNLTFRWSVNGGSISGTGPSVVWNAPDKPGTYIVNLEINDGHGGIQGDSISVHVSTETVVSSQKPQGPYVDLYGHVTDVSVGEEIILYLSVINPITSPGELSVQLTLRIPSGWSITSSGFGHGGGGMRTNTYEIEQGPSPKQIEVHILANEAYKGEVIGYMDYYFEEDTKYHNETSLPVTASMVGASPESTTPPVPPSPNGSKNNGISGTLIAIIVGVCTATIGGVFARLIWRRVHQPVTVGGGILEELPPPTTDEYLKPHIEDKPKPYKEDKKYDPPDLERIPEEKILDIKDGQKGISYESLFFPYIKDARLITIYDPHIQAPYQISNLREFCEILDTHEDKVKVKLVTSHDEFPDSKQENKLNEFKKELADINIEFDYVFDQALHDRWIETDTGWRIILGRGLDIFQSGIGFSDQTKRKCRKTTVTFTRLKKDE